jgi:hypothetical protein
MKIGSGSTRSGLMSLGLLRLDGLFVGERHRTARELIRLLFMDDQTTLASIC